MLNIIRNLLHQLLNDIDTGNTNLSESQLEEIINLILRISIKEMSKLEAADYIGVSRATFDNYVKNGLIPQGLKRRGFKELSWNKSDLDKFLLK